MAGSYVNFYLGTRRVIVPLLDSQRDGAALRKLKALFPRREVVGVPGREILLGGGNVIAHHAASAVRARARGQGTGDREDSEEEAEGAATRH